MDNTATGFAIRPLPMFALGVILLLTTVLTAEGVVLVAETAQLAPSGRRHQPGSVAVASTTCRVRIAGDLNTSSRSHQSAPSLVNVYCHSDHRSQGGAALLSGDAASRSSTAGVP